ncbi:acyl-CoA dehydrogenase family protein [Orrella sp. 11846]|uniref:acyl-CoA dehydrogenase family protein n=1 Tax=Orrella sp. 11846 TaxID=3409913 RepID=UPI003B5C8BE2
MRVRPETQTETTQSTQLPDIPDGRGRNLYRLDPDLPKLLSLYLSPEAMAHFTPHFDRLGQVAGERLDDLAFLADQHTPTLSTRTRQGLDRDEIYKHPAYVELERWAFSEFGMAAASHRAGVLGWPEALPTHAKYTLFYLFTQTEFGLTCPVNMTDSLTRTLRKYATPELIDKYLPALTSLDFDVLFQGAMFMTEQAMGSDIAGTETRAVEEDGQWKLYGDKWFCSNPDADLAMVLARPDGAPAGMAGVSLFLLPRIKDDGHPNHYRILRLKEKLGTRSMPSGEIRFEGAHAYLIGEIGRGFQQMAEMVNSSRLSNGIRSAALMRRAYTEACYVADNRHAFGQRLKDLPLMRRQLDKLELATEQARSFGFQTAQALQDADQVGGDAKKLVRILTPLIKFRACRDARKVAGDAMEVRGGCGYIEEWIEARLVRESHLGSVWEGTSNIVALDVLRAIRRNDALSAYIAHFDALLAHAETALPDQQDILKKLRHSLEQVEIMATQITDADDQILARELASLMYYVGCAITFAWEASHSGMAHRMTLCLRTYRHSIRHREMDLQDALEDTANH